MITKGHHPTYQIVDTEVGEVLVTILHHGPYEKMTAYGVDLATETKRYKLVWKTKDGLNAQNYIRIYSLNKALSNWEEIPRKAKRDKCTNLLIVKPIIQNMLGV